jgi:hypothetical protein
MTDEPQNLRVIRGGVTLRITEADVLASQLTEDDLSALAPFGGEGPRGVSCDGGYVHCPVSYKNEVIEA